jgi:hypothetical protein
LTGYVKKESKMGKLTWLGWQTSVENAPQPTSILYGANLRSPTAKESPVLESKEPDYVLQQLKNSNIPVTRENYLALAYPEGLPEDWGAEGEAGLPEEIRKS